MPPEARAESDAEDYVGLLLMSLYGTRDAAANFQAEVRKFMLSQGFHQAQYSPQIFSLPGRDLRTLVHGDDFMTSGNRANARWFRKVLESRFELKTVVVGSGSEESAEGRVLGRSIRITPEGWEYQADPRHSEMNVRDHNLLYANGVKSPGSAPSAHEDEENNEPLIGAEITKFRASAARANYLSQDRTDLQFAAKEICRGMANPTVGHARALRRLARYLILHPQP